MKYGTQTRLKYLYPYTRKIPRGIVIKDKAEMRLKWMDYIDKGNSLSRTSRHFDKPVSVIKYWFDRYDRWDLTSLEDRSKRPKRVRKTAISYETRQRIIEIRKMYPRWGKIKIQLYLKEEGINVGQSRIQKVINQHNLNRVTKFRKKIIRKNRKHMYSVPRDILKRPGGLVYLDVKHLMRTGGGRIYQFTALDHATRMLEMRVYPKINSECGRDFFEYLDKKFPFDRIEYVGTDNGSEFLGQFDKELVKRGIKHVFSSPRSPRQNPFVERVIRTVIDEVYSLIGTETSVEDQQKVLDDYVKVYNHIRPHRSLNLNTPMQQFYMLKSYRTFQHVPNPYIILTITAIRYIILTYFLILDE